MPIDYYASLMVLLFEQSAIRIARSGRTQFIDIDHVKQTTVKSKHGIIHAKECYHIWANQNELE